MSTSDPSLKRHVVVSGGSRGLGAALVQGLLDAGYRVSSFSRKPTDFTKSLAANGSFFFAPADIGDMGAVKGFLEGAQAHSGAVFGLVNCAGIAVEGLLATMPTSQIDSVIGVNLSGTLTLTRLVLRKMLLANGGSIINISSIIGMRGYSGLSAYAATKGGMDAMTRALARELGGRGIRVNSIAPGYLETEMTHGLDDKQRQQIVRRTPMGRLGQPRDVVGLTCFLMSDASAFITGQVIAIDGGITT